MEKMSSGHVEYIGILLVREYLTAKRLVSTLRCMELEFPLKIRHSNMRLLLSRMFNIDADASSCAESLNSYQSMLEIIMRDFISNKANYTNVECSLQQFESDECPVPKSVTPELKTFQISNTRCESAKMRSSTSLEDILESRTRSSSLQITRETTVNFKKNYDFQNVKKLMNSVAIQGKSKYMTRDEESLMSDGNPMQGYGADQPRDYPKQHSQSCLRDREEILMSSLRRSPDYLNTDNSIRLGPNKVNTFQCLKTNLEPQSGTDETAKKYERFSRIIPKISKRLSDSSLGTTKTLQDSDKAKESVPCESIKIERSPVEDTRPSTPTYSEHKTASCNDSSLEQERSDMVNSENKCVSISKECMNTHVSNKEDTTVLSDDEKIMNIDESESVQSENSESINITNSSESDTIRIPLDGNLNVCRETNNENPKKDTSEIEEESSENQTSSLEIENTDEENKECELPNSSEENKGNNFCIRSYEDIVNEQVESVTFQPISTKLSKRLTKLFSGDECSIDVPSRWKGQSFVFNDSTKLKYGLMQAQGGPCGVIAVVQAFLLKALLFDDKTQAVCQDPFRPTQMELRTGLVHAISEILWQAGKGERAVLALYESTGNEDEEEEEEEEDGEVRENKETKEKIIICRKFNKLQDLQSTIKQELKQFLSTDGNGCYLVAISAILSSGIESVLSDMDEASNSLIVNGGSCSLELVNLLLTGNAVSNVFDNNMHIGPCLLKGVSKRSNIGFLSIYEHTNTCQVGSNLKTPRYPIWVVNCQNHFTVIYSENKKLISDWRAERQFNIYLYDSMNHQKDEVKLTIDTTGLYLKPRSDGEYVPPIELCLLTKWKGAAISWNGNKYM